MKAIHLNIGGNPWDRLVTAFYITFWPEQFTRAFTRAVIAMLADVDRALTAAAEEHEAKVKESANV
jgi:hypothetical protein